MKTPETIIQEKTEISALEKLQKKVDDNEQKINWRITKIKERQVNGRKGCRNITQRWGD